MASSEIGQLRKAQEQMALVVARLDSRLRENDRLVAAQLSK